MSEAQLEALYAGLVRIAALPDRELQALAKHLLAADTINAGRAGLSADLEPAGDEPLQSLAVSLGRIGEIAGVVEAVLRVTRGTRELPFERDLRAVGRPVRPTVVDASLRVRHLALLHPVRVNGEDRRRRLADVEVPAESNSPVQKVLRVLVGGLTRRVCRYGDRRGGRWCIQARIEAVRRRFEAAA